VTGAATMFSRRRALELTFGLSFLAACKDSSDPEANVVATVEVTPAAATLAVAGETRQLAASAKNARGETIGGVTITWRSQDTSVVSVDPTGLVTARGSGTAAITASVSYVGGRAMLTVDQEIVALAFVVGPNDAVAGDSLKPAIQVELRDAGGSRVTDAAVPVTLALGASPAGATLGGTLTVTSTAGIATFRGLSLDKAAAGYTLTASIVGVAPVTSAGFTVTPGPVLLSFLTQPGSVEGQVPFDPVVRVTAREDRFGNVVPGAVVTVGLQGYSSTHALRGLTTATAVNGVAEFEGLSPAVPGDGFLLVATSGAATPARSAPFNVRLTFVQVVAGGPTCGLTLLGFAYCWGGNNVGQLGDGTTITRLVPSPVQGGLRFVQLTTGGGSACGLTNAHEAYCWGANGSGNLGDGTTVDRLGPALVAGGLSFAQVSAGAGHTCGVTTQHVAYCWGYGDYGQLGDGAAMGRLTPTPVDGTLDFVQVSAGALHTCGVTVAHVAYCWGENQVGELGDSSTTRRFTPTAVAGGIAFVQVSAHEHRTCGIASDSAAYCWGDFQRSPTLVPGGLDFAQVDAGAFYNCGVTTAGLAYCWGENNHGQLGDGTTDTRSTPTLVADVTDFVSVSASLYHTCGVTVANVAYCWGDNASGQLGDGTATQRLKPIRVVQ
jgi:alpha-tubulin suppressor-like RCC1 family protein